MTKKPAKRGRKPTKKNGRPKIEIDFNVVAGMCNVWATEAEIAEYFGCTIKTLYRRCKEEMGGSFVQFYKKNNSRGKMSVRRAQFKLATEGQNATMLIWLGKNHLGQRDQPGDSDETMKPTPVSVSIQVENAD